MVEFLSRSSTDTKILYVEKTMRYQKGSLMYIHPSIQPYILCSTHIQPAIGPFVHTEYLIIVTTIYASINLLIHPPIIHPLFYPCGNPFTHPSIYSVNPSSICPLSFEWIPPSMDPFILQSMNPSSHPSINLSIYPSIQKPIQTFINLSTTHTHINLLSIHLFIHLSIPLHGSIYPSSQQSIHP